MISEVPKVVNLAFLPETSMLKSYISDGKEHPIKMRTDQSFLKATLRKPNASNDLDTIDLSSKHLSFRFIQNLANSIQSYEEGKWYDFTIFANKVDNNSHELSQIDTKVDTPTSKDTGFGRDERLDQPNFGAQPIPLLRSSTVIPRATETWIRYMSEKLVARNPDRGIDSIASEVSSRIAGPNGHIIPSLRIMDVLHAKRVSPQLRSILQAREHEQTVTDSDVEFSDVESEFSEEQHHHPLLSPLAQAVQSVRDMVRIFG